MTPRRQFLAALPIFSDDAFEPVFGLCYGLTDQPTRFATARFLQENRARRFQMRELDTTIFQTAFHLDTGRSQALWQQVFDETHDSWTQPGSDCLSNYLVARRRVAAYGHARSAKVKPTPADLTCSIVPRCSVHTDHLESTPA